MPQTSHSAHRNKHVAVLPLRTDFIVFLPRLYRIFSLLLSSTSPSREFRHVWWCVDPFQRISWRVLALYRSKTGISATVDSSSTNLRRATTSLRHAEVGGWTKRHQTRTFLVIMSCIDYSTYLLSGVLEPGLLQVRRGREARRENFLRLNALDSLVVPAYGTMRRIRIGTRRVTQPQQEKKRPTGAQGNLGRVHLVSSFSHSPIDTTTRGDEQR